jgi:hypothetical protein
MWQEGYIFNLDRLDFYTFFPDKDGNVMFLIHDVCLETIDHVLENRKEVLFSYMPQATLETFYDSLCKQYTQLAKGPRQNSDLSGFEWDYGHYGAQKFKGYYDWKAGHGDEVGNLRRCRLVLLGSDT